MAGPPKYTDADKVYELWEEDIRRLADLDDAKINKLERERDELINMLADEKLISEHFRREASNHLSMWVDENKKAGELSDKLNEIRDILGGD